MDYEHLGANMCTLKQGSANFLSRGPNPLSKEKHSAHFNIVLLYLSKNYMPVNKSRLQ